MKGFNFLRKHEERAETEWGDLGREVKFRGNEEVSPMSPDVRRMQEQAQRLREMQEARGRAMKVFDKNFDEMNKKAGVEKFRK
ncbi:hypothetical protein IJG98_02170 [Candidatus Saccharibacteria bacterium]|nr:hypothetical protein [Candidatus Saccharibacteria bacterium]